MAIGTDGVISADLATAWSSMTGKASERGTLCVTARRSLVGRLRVVVSLCSGARGMTVGLREGLDDE